MTKPLAIVLEVEFLDRLAEPVREGRAKSVSDIIRTALERYDLSNVIIVRPSQLAISVRLPVEVRRNLKKVARAKHTSIGQLVRAAVEAYLPALESQASGQLEMPIPHVELPPPAASGPESAAAKAAARHKPAAAAKKKKPAKARPARTRAKAAARKRAMTRKRAKG
ncbi:MAG: hypothetical protein HYV95_00820 [Opitutae bacterium]|nr:hypothetical protein [Opitutae bacterium]